MDHPALPRLTYSGVFGDIRQGLDLRYRRLVALYRRASLPAPPHRFSPTEQEMRWEEEDRWLMRHWDLGEER